MSTPLYYNSTMVAGVIPSVRQNEVNTMPVTGDVMSFVGFECRCMTSEKNTTKFNTEKKRNTFYNMIDGQMNTGF